MKAVRTNAAPDGAITPTSNTSAQEYRSFVDRAKAYARAGDIFQVVPSQRFEAPFEKSPFALYRALRRINPSPFLFYLNFDGFSIVGSSPEILVRLKDDMVTIRPIAGTRPRGKSPAEDAALEEELLADPKERAEHLMLLDLGRNDVGRVALRGRRGNAAGREGGVRVTQSFGVERYSHVMHIVSNVEGRIAPGYDAVDALFAGFPAGTVSGAPKVRAMEIINELEKAKRGVYAGGVGYFSAGGEMDTCIALRTAVVKDGVLYVQAGGGVVLDSDPQLELEETEHKARALFRAAEEAWRFS
jgi:anthranilate synthase component 1